MRKCDLLRTYINQVWLRKFSFPKGYKVYRVIQSSRVDLYGTIGSGSLIVSMDPAEEDEEEEAIELMDCSTQVNPLFKGRENIETTDKAQTWKDLSNEIEALGPTPSNERLAALIGHLGNATVHALERERHSSDSDESEESEEISDISMDYSSDSYDDSEDDGTKPPPPHKLRFGIPAVGLEGREEGSATGILLKSCLEEVKVRRARYNGRDCIGLFL